MKTLAELNAELHTAASYFHTARFSDFEHIGEDIKKVWTDNDDGTADIAEVLIWRLVAFQIGGSYGIYANISEDTSRVPDSFQICDPETGISFFGDYWRIRSAIYTVAEFERDDKIMKHN